MSRLGCLNSSLSIASKHLRRNGLTRSASFVSERISSSSSFDRKKNRGNARRFVSRYLYGYGPI